MRRILHIRTCNIIWTQERLLSSSHHGYQQVQKPEHLSDNKRHFLKREPIVICKNETLNHYRNQTYGKFSVIHLASQGWHHRKSKGDFFTVQNNEVPVHTDSQDVSFRDLNLLNDTVEVLEEKGITKPTYIQARGIKYILDGCNTLLAAETGSGKTFAYLLPVLKQIYHRRFNIIREQLNCPLGIIVSPSRELVYQIGENARILAEKLGINVAILSGGGTKQKILSPTFKEVDLLVASIGALNKLLSTGIYRVSHVQHVVLDEADTLFDDSFKDSLQRFLHRFKFISSPQDDTIDNRPLVQLTMVSATMPSSADEVLQEFISPDLMKRVSSKQLHYVPSHVPQKFYRLGYHEKPSLLLNLLKADDVMKSPVLIFSNKPSTCDWISLFLNENNIHCLNLNKKMDYKIRRGRFEEFQAGAVNVLSCTDMGSRGLDTIRVKHLINYDFPLYMADYIHRCGRTGRLGSPENCHISHFVAGPLEIELVKKIELSVRRREPLPNVDGNIKRLLTARIANQQL